AVLRLAAGRQHRVGRQIRRVDVDRLLRRQGRVGEFVLRVQRYGKIVQRRNASRRQFERVAKKSFGRGDIALLETRQALEKKLLGGVEITHIRSHVGSRVPSRAPIKIAADM